MGSSATGRMKDDAPGDQRNGIHEVMGSIPISSTNSGNKLAARGSRPSPAGSNETTPLSGIPVPRRAMTQT